ncbi:MAG: phosphoenolpyruvate carboxylase [Polyangiaceae bacterium]|nr:phosphoenolpyruvate carboxylase [Polyangiaceae bacterium]
MATLHDDVNRLGRLLGRVVQEQQGAAFFELLEDVRTQTKALREAGLDTAPLQARLARVSLAEAEGLVRAFSLYFQLVNLAEDHERLRRVAEAPGPRRQGLEDALRQLAARGLSADAAEALVAGVELGLTFTAHPTEMRRRTVREHLAAIAREFGTLEAPASEARITAHVEALWGTLELERVEPTVRDEVVSGLGYVAVIASVLPALERELRAAFPRVFGRETALELPLALCSWIGGDRDGNPNVTPEVTRETFAYHAASARTLLRAAITEAYASLSQHAVRLGRVPPELAGPPEPWRAALFALHEELGGDGPVEPAPRLAAVERTLHECGQHRSAECFALPLRVTARALGVHFVSLDIREHSAVTGAAVAELFLRAGRGGYAAADERTRCTWLEAELATRRPLLAVGEVGSDALRSVLEPLRAARDAMAAAGPRAFGRYVTSMSEDVSDLLEVLVLGREAGVRVLPVPLFETREDLARAPEVLRAVLALGAYRAHLGDDVQEVMIGYSDSNKDAGFFAAHWSLHQAQRRVAEVCRGAGVRYRFFHGRGTSIGRGGGPMVRGLLGQPPGTIGAGLRITEQGEALADKYSHPERARRNLEQALYGLLVAAAAEPEPLPDAWVEALDRAAEASVQAYRALVEDPGFLPFFEAVTPINEIARLRIASRPVRRPGPATLQNLRAIPWVMAWTQNRANVPGWYGLDTALAALGEPLARELYLRAPLFRAMLDNAQLALATSDAGIFRAYLGLAPDGSALGARILEARERTERLVAGVLLAPLLAGEPALARSIALRNPYVEPIHRLQVELLRRARARALAGEPVDVGLERALLLSIHGIAAGVRNAG